MVGLHCNTATYRLTAVTMRHGRRLRRTAAARQAKLVRGPRTRGVDGGHTRRSYVTVFPKGNK